MMKKFAMTLAGWLLCGSVLAQNPPPQRIVAAGGSLVELIWALDAGDKVVGVDETAVWPPQVKQLPQIGYWKQLSIEGILSLRPDLFITWQDAEPRLIFDQLKHHNIRTVALPRTPATPERLYENILALAEAVQAAEKGQALVASLRQRLDRVAGRNACQTHPVRVMFLLAPGGSTPQVAGEGSVANVILTLAGGKNVATHRQYRSYSSEAIIAANPDVIVVTSQSGQGARDKLAASVPGIDRTAAWKNQRIVEIDQSLILGMGPRIVDAVEYLHQQFWPQPDELKADAACPSRS
ncbi:Hemin-binding periplasmic protein HmuT [Mixta intestinalis]|uniref:Hemin-binding periplasmic protein HmuT n=2 Tax=Mixta intestinalis TaxID=1615494 RepID=A0A6P1Q2R4_9GAMM|nr:Hemin-binding periplasmic protein HmuT [Mixta intestinalis]